MAAFREDVDALQQAKLEVVGTSLRAWEVMGFEIRDSHIVRDPKTGLPILHKWPQELEKYRDALVYAKSKGLKVHLHLAPNWHQDLSDVEYLYVTRETFSFVAEMLAEYVDVWQLWNEADIHDYRSYQTITAPSESYLAGFWEAFRAAASEIRKVDPHARISMNVGGFYGISARSATHSRWLTVFDSARELIVQGLLTDIKLNIYTEGDNTGVLERVNEFNKYGIPIWVGEFGVCTVERPYSEEDKRRMLLDAIHTLRRANVAGIHLYRIRDDATENGCEGSFGVYGRYYVREVLEAMN